LFLFNVFPFIKKFSDLGGFWLHKCDLVLLLEYIYEPNLMLVIWSGSIYQSTVNL
jgi:hypothetical protein